jgi:gamma-glutamylcyclotransferase (GGCT)/AIG2-like uncharacterized protein YtfP
VAVGSVAGTLVRISWYPGLVLDPQEGPVRGEVWEVSSRLLAELDRFEGCDPASGEGEEYRRVRALVKLDDGGESAAWLWDWKGGVAGHPRVEGGDWMG